MFCNVDRTALCTGADTDNVKDLSDDVEWAGFYSDCEHEVSEVKSGHPITLTYNLYSCPSGGPHVIRPDTLPIARKLHRILASETFLSPGGVIGFFCKHAYARHRGSTSATQNMIEQLKCIDRASSQPCWPWDSGLKFVRSLINAKCEKRPRV